MKKSPVWTARASAVGALATVGALTLSGVAVADDIANNLDTSVDAVAEVMGLNVGGASRTTQLYVVERNGDGKQGCNLTGGKVLQVSVNSSNVAVAAVSPSSLTFTSCSDVKTLTVTPVSEGSATVSLTQVANTTAGSFDLAPATFVAMVAKPANTAPRVSVSGVRPGESYAKGEVPQAMCEVSDAEDGSRSFPATLGGVVGPYAVDGIGSQTASCSYTDAGGLTASAAATYDIVDLTAPVITATIESPDGLNGWYRGEPTLTWDVSEPESPSSLQKLGCEDVAVVADQALTAYTCSASSAGGEADEIARSVKRDATRPEVNLNRAMAGTYYWGYVPQAPTCDALDALSGWDGTCTVSGYSAAKGDHTLRASAMDHAGNEGTASSDYSVLGWTVRGFTAPVDMGATRWNSIKGGATVPMKFQLFAGSELTETSAVKSFTQKQVTCPAAGSMLVDEIETPLSGGTSLRYDTTGGQFIQNWQTPKKPGACFTATMTAQDGSSVSANFLLR